MELLAFAVGVSVLGPQVLRSADWVYRSPRLGIVAWYAALTAVLSAVAVTVVSWVAPWQGANAPVCTLWRWCMEAAAGGYGVAGRLIVATVAAVGAASVARLVVTAVRMVWSASARRDRHLKMLKLAGRVSPELGATVLDHPHPAAYVVGGSSRRVVVTTGALGALTAPELAAVLAHERAHATGRHDRLLDGVRLLEKAFPRVALFAIARGELGRLVELRADEIAVTRHAPISLARAIVAMATTSSPSGAASTSPMLAGALAATGGQALERLNRLLTPPAPLRRAQRATIGVMLTAVALAPVVFAMGAQFVPALGACLPMPA